MVKKIKFLFCILLNLRILFFFRDFMTFHYVRKILDLRRNMKIFFVYDFTCLFTVLSCWWFLSSFVFFLISFRSFLFFSKPGFELFSSRFAPLRNSRVLIGPSWLISAALKKWIIYPLAIQSAPGVFSLFSRVRCNFRLLFSPLWEFSFSDGQEKLLTSISQN